MTPEQALSNAKRLYERERPIGWRTFNLDSIKVADRAHWYARQIKQAYPYEDYFEDAEQLFYRDLITVLRYVNAGKDPNLTGDLTYNFKRLCRNAKNIASLIWSEEDPAERIRRLKIFGMH